MSNLNRSYKIAPRNLSRSEFLTPFDAIFDDMINSMFPAASRDLGENFFNKGSYPKVNVINKSDSLLIEAASIALGIPPGINRSFLLEKWLDFETPGKQQNPGV